MQDKNSFERKFMEQSWSLSNNQYHNYRKFVVEDSVKKFYQFLKSKNVIKGKVLDLGCGNGKHTIYFEQQGFDSVGIDFASNAIKLCKSNVVKEQSKAQFKVMDVLDYDIKRLQSSNEGENLSNKNSSNNNNSNSSNNNQNMFDIILDCGCLHHLRKRYWKKYVSNLTKTLKKGGYFYLHGFCDQSYKFGIVEKNKRWRVRKGHYSTFFSNKDISKWFGKHFDIIKTHDFPNTSKSYMIRAFWMKRK